MSGVTGDFDIAVHVREEVLDRIFQAMHRSGAFQHRYVRAYGNKRVELLINRPRVFLETAPNSDGRARARVEGRVHYHARALSDAGDPGTHFVVDVSVRCVLYVTTGDPAPLTPEAALVADWQETTADDIGVHATSDALRDEVRAALLDFVREDGGGAFGIPPLGGAGARVGSLAFRFLPAAPAPGTSPTLVVGMNLDGSLKGSKWGLTEDVVNRAQGKDWAFAVSGPYVLDGVRERLRQQLGSLPPPYGPAPVTISDTTVCVLPTPFGCADSARQRDVLERFEVGLQPPLWNIPLLPGAFVFTGQVSRLTDSVLVPNVTATFSAVAVPFVGPDQQIRVQVSQPNVQIDQWYARVFNFVSFGAIESAVRDALRGALQEGAQEGGFSSLFSAQTLRQLAAVGVAADLRIEPRATGVGIRRDAVIVEGTVDIGEDFPPFPQVSLASLSASGAPGRRILHAGGTWVPGGYVTRYEWGFGDGQDYSSGGSTAAFVETHDYPSGWFNACLTVTDDFGNRATRCVRFGVGVFDLRVDYDPPGYDVRNEYIAIRNVGEAPEQMEGWVLSDLARHRFVFPRFTLEPGSEVRLWTGSGSPDGSNLYWGRRQAVWNNTGDTAILRNRQGAEVLRHTYSP